MAGLPDSVLWTLVVYTVTFPVLFIVAARAWWVESRQRRLLSRRLKGIGDVEAEAARIRHETNVEVAATRQAAATFNAEYAERRRQLDAMAAQAASFSETIGLANAGLYAPHFDFDHPDAFKQAILANRARQSEMVKSGRAVVATRNFAFRGSVADGQAMTAYIIGLTLRAFNGEADAAIGNARWHNIGALEQRIVRAREQIDRLNAGYSIFIGKDYVALKLEELYLTHDHREKLRKEAEKRAEANRRFPEDPALKRDLEGARDEQTRAAGLLNQARIEASSGGTERLKVFAEQIKGLERDLAAAQAKVARAQAAIERKRSGYVYIVSNIGAFGEGVFKIGFTRRLQPEDAIGELGDDSVPFGFDAHALIYTDDGPNLRHAFHTALERYRLNTSDAQRDFFRISTGELEAVVKRLVPDAIFLTVAEAREYRESLALRQALEQPTPLPSLAEVTI